MSNFHKLSTRTLQAHWHWYLGKTTPLPDEHYFSLLSNTLITDDTSEAAYLALCVCAKDMDFPDENARASWLVERMWNIEHKGVSVAWKTTREIVADTAPLKEFTCTVPPRRRKPQPKKRVLARSNRKDF